jgi:protein-S-isoprenylcysteine O-methyltransferase Ste14
MRSLEVRIARNSLAFHAQIASLLFASAGTLRYPQAWAYLALNFVGTTTVNLYLLRKDRSLLERRLTLDEQGEPLRAQRIVILCLRISFAAMLVVAGLDHRFGWSSVAPAPSGLGLILFAAGTALIFLVFRENSYSSSVIEVDARQCVVDTGPYRFVRHPMYSGALIMGLATPLVLGSYWAEMLLLPSIALVVVRLRTEERLLAEQLEGYREYLESTRARLIPSVW